MTQQGYQRRWWSAVLPVVVLLILVVLGILASSPGIYVTIENTGQTKIGSIVLHVTGRSYSLGDLDPGSARSTAVISNGESHLEIEFSSAGGNTSRVNAGGYFLPKSRGKIRVTIKDGLIDQNQQDISIWGSRL